MTFNFQYIVLKVLILYSIEHGKLTRYEEMEHH